MQKQFAVLGDPIEHSLSPILHRSAYGVLGLGWKYDIFRVTSGQLAEFVDGLDSQWHGFSVTMPLKEEALAYADEIDDMSSLTGASNTLVFHYEADGRKVHGYNTDVPGLQRALEKTNWTFSEDAWLFGGGSTARSAIVALHGLGITSIHLVMRNVNKAADLLSLTERLGISITAVHDAEYFEAHPETQIDGIVVNTLPNFAELETFAITEEQFSSHTMLYEVSYGQKPSPIVTAVSRRSGTVVSGLSMLVEQAIAQLRLFYHGNMEDPLPDEEKIIEAMNHALKFQ